MIVRFFDTESTDLSASWGRILLWSWADLGGEVQTDRGDRAKFRTGSDITDDSKLCTKIRDVLEDADLIVSWNGILHDIPLLNARLRVAGERECRVGEKYGVWHLDLMYYAAGQSMKVGGKRLETVSRFFRVNHAKTPLDGKTWQQAGAGNRKALDAIQEHCEMDVLVLRDLWPHLVPFVKKFTFNLGEVYPFIEQIERRGR